jgi:adenosylmethionine-8-amino-7-oxononanoate aminotransferase
MIMPPYTVTDEDIDYIVEVVGSIIDEVFKEIK